LQVDPLSLILVGVIAGLLPGVFGFGGGWLLVPILTGLLGVDWAHASGLALCAIMAGAVSGVVNRLGKPRTDAMPAERAVTGALVAGAVVGSIFGKACVRDALADLPEAPIVLDVVLAGVLVAVAVRYLFAAVRGPSPRPATRPALAVLGAVGLMTLLPGALSGLTGIGGGVLYLPILVFLLHWREDRARDASRLAVLGSAIVAGSMYAHGGGVPFVQAACMFVPAALVGALTSALPIHRRRRTFALVAGALALVAVALTVLHAVRDGGSSRPAVGGGLAAAALVIGGSLAWGIACGLTQRALIRWRRRLRQPGAS